MTGISPTGLGLPTPRALFTSGAATAAPASTVPVNGPMVSGPGGTTALPSASPADFQGVNPTPLDQPHPQYPSLIQSHVALLQAIGTPGTVIAQLASTQPAADYLDRYIQGEIMQNPEGWDSYVGNPAGTARAGLKQLVPNIQLPAPGTGTPGQLPDGGRVDGVNIPGITQPLVGPQQGSSEGIIKGVVIAAAVAGVGLLAWKYVKGRNPANDLTQLLGKERSLGLMAGNPALDDALQAAAGVGSKGSGWLSGAKGGGADVQRLLSMQATVGGGAHISGTYVAATLESIQRGQGAAHGFLNSVAASAKASNQPFHKMADLALQSDTLAMARAAVDNGTIGELAAAGFSFAQLAGTAASGAGAKAGAVQQALAGVANALA